MKYPFIILDLETTGTNPREDLIVEICAIKVEEAYKDDPVIKKAILNPGIEIPQSAIDCHGITNEMVKDAPRFKQIAKSLLEFMDGFDIVSYNGISFDIPMLYCEFLRAGLTWDYSKSNFIDVQNIFKRNEERTLSAAVKFYLGEDHEGAHGAEADCKATVRVLEAQLLRYPDLNEKNNAELALFSNYDKEILDISGCFAKNEAGQIILNFGKNKGKVAKDQRPYLQWMLTADFPPDTRKIINQIMYNK